MYESEEIKIFPHALTKYVVSCPQHAVFRIEASNGKKAYMAISSNPFVCRFTSSWQAEFDDFLIFARANGYTANNLVLAEFFKRAPGEYWRSHMKSSFDLWEFVEEIRPLNTFLENIRKAVPQAK